VEILYPVFTVHESLLLLWRDEPEGYALQSITESDTTEREREREREKSNIKVFEWQACYASNQCSYM